MYGIFKSLLEGVQDGLEPKEPYSPQAMDIKAASLLQQLSQGGLAQIRASQSLSTVEFALGCLNYFLEGLSTPAPYLFWVADEGLPNAPLIASRWRIPLSRLLCTKTPSAQETWRLSLEATQTGLFAWILVRPSAACPVAFLRKLQLASERQACRLLLLTEKKLPHWPLKTSVELGDAKKNSFLSQSAQFAPSKRSVLLPYPQSVSPSS